MDVLARLDEVRTEVNVLEHPFYLRWSAGELSTEEMGTYSGEYRHAVVALAEASALAASKAGPAHADGLGRHAREEAAHVELWDEFAREASSRASISATGAQSPPSSHLPLSSPAPPSPPPLHLPLSSPSPSSLPPSSAPLAETIDCTRAWTAGEDLLEHLAVLYAIEAGQPEVSRTKIDGLTSHYGYTVEGPAVEYFRVHELRDVDHARQARELIEELIDGVDDPREQADRMVDRARAALQGNWSLLDGVEASRVSRGALTTIPV